LQGSKVRVHEEGWDDMQLGGELSGTINNGRHDMGTTA
jgi:hypothetical protein